MAAFQPLHTAAILAKSDAGRSVVMAASGAGPLAVTDLETGTDAPTGARATSSSLAALTATTPRSAAATAVKKEK